MLVGPEALPTTASWRRWGLDRRKAGVGSSAQAGSWQAGKGQAGLGPRPDKLNSFLTAAAKGQAAGPGCRASVQDGQIPERSLPLLKGGEQGGEPLGGGSWPRAVQERELLSPAHFALAILQSTTKPRPGNHFREVKDLGHSCGQAAAT